MRIITLLISSLLLSACAMTGSQIRTDPVAGTDFSRYPTFQIGLGQILGQQGAPAENTPANNAIAHLLRQELTARGLKEDAGQASITVNYVAGARQDISPVEKLPNTVEYDRNTGSWSQEQSWSRTTTEGGLIIEMRDSGDQKLIWRAFIQSEIGANSDERKLRTAIHKAISQYPGPKTATP